MKAKDLIDIINETEDEFIHDAGLSGKGTANRKDKTKRFPKWVKWSSFIAAGMALVVGVAFLLPQMGGSSSPGGSNAGGSGHEEGSVFMSYAGPVFPLTLREENNALTARRSITMDFSPWIPVWVSNPEEVASRTDLTDEEQQKLLEDYSEWYPEGGHYISSGDILVSDAYVLTNNDTKEQNVSVLYPFVSSLRSLEKNCPSLTLEGEAVNTKLHAGSYAGGFQGAWDDTTEAGENPGTLNLQRIQSWEGYQTLLLDGTYLERALGDFVNLSDIPVIIYELTDAWGPEADSDEGVPNPSIRVMFEMDYEKTRVLSYGFNAGYYDSDNGIMGKAFSIREEWEPGYGNPYYLIVLGDDIENIQCVGYATGGWDTEKKVEAGVTVMRSEGNLEMALRQAAGYFYRELIDAENCDISDYDDDFELYFGLLKEHLMSYGILSENCADRYDGGNIEEMDVFGVERIFWLEAELAIPAGGSVSINAVFEKEPSYDFHCAVSENKGISGYDLVTAMGSSLEFVEQTAVLKDWGQIEIVRQNFGFNLENNINEVMLDINEPHYYLEVRKVHTD